MCLSGRAPRRRRSSRRGGRCRAAKGSMRRGAPRAVGCGRDNGDRRRRPPSAPHSPAAAAAAPSAARHAAPATGNARVEQRTKIY